MKGDVFGDLRAWGRVLGQIAELRKAKKLDEHQEGLTRILRYPSNWRLREEVLDVRPPGDARGGDDGVAGAVRAGGVVRAGRGRHHSACRA